MTNTEKELLRVNNDVCNTILPEFLAKTDCYFKKEAKDARAEFNSEVENKLTTTMIKKKTRPTDKQTNNIAQNIVLTNQESLQTLRVFLCAL